MADWVLAHIFHKSPCPLRADNALGLVVTFYTFREGICYAVFSCLSSRETHEGEEGGGRPSCRTGSHEEEGWESDGVPS